MVINNYIHLGYTRVPLMVDQTALPQPDSISGLFLWLRPDAIVSPVDGAKFSTWTDKSVNAASIVQNTSSAQFVYNASDAQFGHQPSITGAGSARMRSNNNTSLPQPLTVYVAFQTNSIGTYQVLLSDQSDAFELGLNGLSENNVYTYTSSTVYTTYGSLADSNPHLVCYDLNASATTVYLDNSGSPLTSAGTLPSSGFLNNIELSYTGGDSIIGNIAEYIVYTGAHTLAQRQVIFAYMAQRYAQPWS